MSTAESPAIQRGRLKVYFSYAAGTGKTYQMLVEAQQLKERGIDVVIGYLEPHAREDTLSRADSLEVVPRKQIQFRGAAVAEMDTEAILRRHPLYCVVDELAHTNVPGATRGKRWEDVQVLLEAGINVLTTMNVENLESLNDQVWQITGTRVRETIPDWVVKEAAEVVMIDLTPRALLHRLERGCVYPDERERTASRSHMEQAALVALRELAMRQVAHEIGVHQPDETQTIVPAAFPRTRDRILIHITSDPCTAMLLRRGRRVADYLNADCLAICIHSEPTLDAMPTPKRQAIERHMRFADSMRVETVIVHGHNPAHTLVEWARANGITQTLISRTGSGSHTVFPGLDFVDQVVQQAGDVQVTIVGEHRREGKAPVYFAEDTAGGLMSPRFARLSTTASVEEAIGDLRRQAESVEIINYAYVLNRDQQLAGVVSFRQLFSADRSKPVADVMRTDLVSVFEDTDREEAARLFTQHRLLAIPVLDRARHMRGIITTGDLVGLIQQEASEDIQKMGGMEALGAPYLEIGFLNMVRKRAGWLAILFVGEMLTATAMSLYSDEIAKAVVLALFLPLIISSGGNSGSQATTLVIRAMAVGELTLRDWFRVVRREIATGVALGALLGTIGVIRILVWHQLFGMYEPHYVLIALTIGCALLGVVTFGTTAGSMLPFILRRCGLDPASASAPFVATLVDVTGLIIYFSVAMAILRGSLL